MTDDVQQLVQEAIELTGGDGPKLLDERTPTLAPEALRGGDEASSFYLVGLIGGKDVGKSSLVNALVGQEITERSSHGRGTDRVIAYVHESQVAALQTLLEREAAGRYSIVTHAIPRLHRQVLLDLPDIDSHYADHVELTRRMLRHMLYPVWVQSVEKYADRMPQTMLARVGEGNAADNFIFCLNKVDQVIAREGEAAAKELRTDYALRLAKTLDLSNPPGVWMISASAPDQYDLPALADLLSQQKAPQTVARSKRLAVNRQSASILAWLDGLNFPAQVERLARLQADAESLCAERIAQPLLDRVIPRILDDPSRQSAMMDDCLKARIRRWPLVNIVHSVLAPLFAFFSLTFGRRGAAPLSGAEGMVAAHLDEHAHRQADRIQTTFAQLQQLSPLVSGLYRHRKLWESRPADLAAAELCQTLVSVLDHQRQSIVARFGRGYGIIGGVVRCLLTIGALLWFPIAQPMLEAFLHSVARPSPMELLIRFVEVLSAAYLLQNVTLLLIYFVLLWVILRYHTQRRVARLMLRRKKADAAEPTLDLSVRALQWTDTLLDEIRLSRERFESLVVRIDALRQSLDESPTESSTA